MIYEIRIKDHLGPQWADRFEVMSMTLEDDGTTLLTGAVVDQAALHGLLRKIRDLGLTLLALNAVDKRLSGKTAKPPKGVELFVPDES